MNPLLLYWLVTKDQPRTELDFGTVMVCAVVLLVGMLGLDIALLWPVIRGWLH